MKKLLLTALCASLVGCAAHAPADFDAKNGRFPSPMGLLRHQLQTEDTNYPVQDVRIVHLIANSTDHQGRFEYLIRESLARLGFATVMTTGELNNFLAADPALSTIAPLRNPFPHMSPYLYAKEPRFDLHYSGCRSTAAGMRELSAALGPVLCMEFTDLSGEDQHLFSVQVYDPLLDRTLIQILIKDHGYLYYSGTLYPALNEIQRWRLAASGSVVARAQ